MFKKLLAIALVAVLTLGGAAIPAATAEAAAPIEITVLFGGNELLTEEPSDVELYFAEKTGVLAKRVFVTDDKKMLLAASGDLEADIVTNCIGDYITGGLLMPLDDLLAQFGPNILKTAHDSTEFMRKFQSQGMDKIYWLPAKNHDSMADYAKLPEYEYQVAPLIRWDYYAELGYPAINDEYQLLDVLKLMVDKHPEQDGKKTYGISLNNTMWTYGTWYSFHKGVGAYGGSTFAMDTKYQYVNNCFDDGFVMFDMLKFYNTAFRMGLFDPETFTQTWENMTDKVKSGQVMFYFESWGSDAMNTALQAKFGENAYMGFPVSASKHVYKGHESSITGWSYNTGLSAHTEKAEACIKFLDYLYTEDGSRVACNGIQGVHWDYDANKVPFITDEFKQNSGDADYMTKAGVGPWHNWAGVSNSALHTDGYYINLSNTEAAILSADKAYTKAYCEYYKVRYPGEAVLKAAEAGTISIDLYDGTASSTIGADATPDDIKRLTTAVDEMWFKLTPKAISAETEEAYNQIIDEFKEELRNIGAQQLIDFYWNQQKEANEAVKGFYN